MNRYAIQSMLVFEGTVQLPISVSEFIPSKQGTCNHPPLGHELKQLNWCFENFWAIVVQLLPSKICFYSDIQPEYSWG